MKQKLYSSLALFLAFLCLTACSRTSLQPDAMRPIRFSIVNVSDIDNSDNEDIHDNYTLTKSIPPSQNRITDLNIFIFNRQQSLEKKIYIKADQLDSDTNGLYFSEELMRGKEYEILACANLGYACEVSSYEEAISLTAYIAYPDDYRMGIPMYTHILHAKVDKNDEIKLPLTRLMSKISIRIDRSKLNSDVNWHVESVKICGCPRSCSIFQPNSPMEMYDIFNPGYVAEPADVKILNSSSRGTTSYIDLYMFENICTANSPTAPYIDMKVRYSSPSYKSLDDNPLHFTFKLQNYNKTVSAYRNTWYRFNVRPEYDGLIH